MRLAVLFVLLAGCKTMNGVGKVADGFGRVAGHAGAELAHLAEPVAKAATVTAHAAAKAAPVVLDAASVAVQVGEPVAEAIVASQLQPDPDPDVIVEPVPPDRDTQDLCLDCPDVGNCNSCLEPGR